MEAWRHRARYAWFKLQSALVTEHQRKVAALRAKRQVDYEERLKSILEAPPTRLFGDENPALDEEELGTSLLRAYQRHWAAKIARLKAIERERPKPPVGTLSPSGTGSATASVQEEEEPVDDDVSLGDEPVKHDAWAVRHQKGYIPALQDAEEVAPVAGYTITDRKALDAMTCAIQSDVDALSRYKHAAVRWPLKGWRRKVCPTSPEAPWDPLAMQRLLDTPAIASREQQRAEDRVLLDSREHQYSSLLPRASVLLCAGCFASLLHGMPNNNQQPAESGPTFDELVQRKEQNGEAASEFAMEASFFVRLEAKEEDSDVYRLCGASGTHEPQPLRQLEAHTLKAATADDRFPFFDAGQGGTNLPSLRITVSVIHSLEVMVSASDFTVGRHGLLLHFLDAHHIRRHSCLLPDVVRRLGHFDLIYRELARKSGYRSPLPRKFFEDRTRCWLYRVEASDATMTFAEYAEQWGVHLAPPDEAAEAEGKGGAGLVPGGWALKARGLGAGAAVAVKS